MSRRHLARLVVLLGLALVCAAAAPGSAGAAADLSIAISASPDPAAADDPVTVRLTAHNKGDAAANGAYMALVVLGSVTLGEGEECINFLGRVAICDVGTIEPGQTVRRSFQFTNPDVGELEFQSSVSSDSADGNPDDNTATRKVTVEPRADLKLGMDLGETKGAARNATLAASVRNTSKGPAREAKLQVEIERGLAVVSLPAGCARAALRVTCDLGTMADRSSATRVIGLRAARKSTYSLVGAVTWAGRDPTPADNQAQALLTTLANTRVVALRRLLRGLPSSGGCVRGRRLRLRLRTPLGSKLSRADLYVAGKRVRRVRGKALRRPVTLRRLPRKRFTLRAQSTMRGGQRLVGHARLVDCSARVV